jgi:RHS repeat-associated protein
MLTLAMPRAAHAKPTSPPSRIVQVELTHPTGTASVNTNASGNTSFTLKNVSGNTLTINLTITACSGALAPSSCTRSPTTVTLLDQQQTSIGTGFSGGSTAGTGTLTLTAKNTGGTTLASASVTVTVNLPPPSGPIVRTAPHLGDRRDPSLCIADCFETTFGYATPAYISRDTPRSVALLYRSGRAKPYGRVTLDVTPRTGTTTAYRLQLVDPNGANVQFTNGSTSLFFANGVLGTRVVGEFDASLIPTSARLYTVNVTGYNGTTPEGTTSDTVRIIIVNGKTSFFGAGVDMAGFQKLYDNASQSGGVLITEGSGAASFFRGSCTPSVTCTFTSPGGDFSVLTTGSNQYKRTYPDGMVVTFDNAGNELSAVDRFGAATSIAYSTNVNGTVVPWAIGDGTGKTIDLRYRTASDPPYQPGSLTTITAPTGGRRAEFRVYAASGNLQQVLDVDNLSYAVLGYDTQHLLTSITDKKGFTTNYRYAYGRPAIDTVDAPNVTIYDGSSVRPRTLFREPYSGLFYAAMLGGGTSATNLIPAPTFDIRAAVTDPLGYSTFFSLNRFGSPQITYTPLTPRSDSAQYDDATGLVTRTVSHTGVEVRYTWDVGGKLTNVKNVTLGTNDSTVYASQFALPVQTISDNSIGQWFTYNQTKTGWPLQYSRLGDSTATPTTYYPDALGRDTAVVDPAGHRTSSYPKSSGLQNTDSVRAPNTQVTWFKRDTLGRVVATRSPTGAVDTLALDILNRTTWAIPPMGGTTQYQYDELNNITTVTDARSQVYSYQHNALGWVTRFTGPRGAADSTNYQYDVAGNVVYMRSQGGRVIKLVYDSLYRVTQKIGDVEHDTITYTYKVDTTVARAVSRGVFVSTDTIFTDSLGRTLKEQTVRPGSGNSWYVASQYNATDPGRTWVKAYKNGNGTAQAGATNYYYPTKQLWAIQLLDFAQTSFGYNADQQDSTVTLPSGLKETWLYTSSHALARRTYSVPAVKSVFDRAYRTDSLARLVERQNGTAGQFQNFYYDLNGRFNFWEKWSQSGTPTCVNLGGYGYDCSSGATRTFQLGTSYDNVDNHTDLGSVLQAGNRLTTYNGFNLTYDADGNMVKRAGTNTDSLDWDDFGQLKSVIRGGSTIASFDYDGFGRRVRQTAGGATIQYVWDGDQIILEADASGTTTQAYTYYPGTDRLHSVTVGGATYYASVEPATGDVNGLIKAVGDTVKAQYNYTPWGGFDTPDQPTINGVRVNSFRWKGLPYDSTTGLYYMRARYYDPALRRFISEDPVGLQGGINKYAFARGDAINRSDPSGLTDNGFNGCWVLAEDTRRRYSDGSTGEPYGQMYVEVMCPSEPVGNSVAGDLAEPIPGGRPSAPSDHTPSGQNSTYATTPRPSLPLQVQDDLLVGCDNYATGAVLSFMNITPIPETEFAVAVRYRFYPQGWPRITGPVLPYRAQRDVFVRYPLFNGAARLSPVYSDSHKGAITCSTGTFNSGPMP